MVETYQNNIDIRLLPSGLNIENKNIIYIINTPLYCHIQLNYKSAEMLYYAEVACPHGVWESEVHFDIPDILHTLGNTVISEGGLDAAATFIVDARRLILREAEIMFNIYKIWYQRCKKELGKVDD